MSCADMQGGFGNTLEEIEHRKKMAEEEIKEMDKEIERIRAEEKLKRNIEVRDLYNRVESLIKTSSSSMTDFSIGEIHEYVWNSFCADEYSYSIDVEVGARYKNDDGSVYEMPLKNLAKSYEHSLTLVVSYLIPFDLIEDDPFFRSK